MNNVQARVKAKTRLKSNKDIFGLVGKSYLLRNQIRKKQKRIKPRIGLFGNALSWKVVRNKPNLASNEVSNIIVNERVKARLENNLDLLVERNRSNSSARGIRQAESYIDFQQSQLNKKKKTRVQTAAAKAKPMLADCTSKNQLSDFDCNNNFTLSCAPGSSEIRKRNRKTKVLPKKSNVSNGWHVESIDPRKRANDFEFDDDNSVNFNTPPENQRDSGTSTATFSPKSAYPVIDLSSSPDLDT